MFLFVWGCVVFVLLVISLILDFILHLKGKSNADKQPKL